jgi:hypothetical protein
MFRELLNGYNDIADDDVAFVNMSIRESKWRQITTNLFQVFLVTSKSREMTLSSQKLGYIQ